MATSIHHFDRQSLRRVRARLSLSYQIHAANAICNAIKTLAAYRYAKKIALYHANQGEVDLNTLWQSAPLQGKTCFFPALTPDKHLSFLPCLPDTNTKKNRFGILEPDVDCNKACLIDNLDIIFMPLVGFDARGNRLGMGGGYYDRTLAQHQNGLLVGVAYHFQQLSSIEPQKWDIPLDIIITDRDIFDPYDKLKEG